MESVQKCDSNDGNGSSFRIQQSILTASVATVNSSFGIEIDFTGAERDLPNTKQHITFPTLSVILKLETTP